MIGLHLQVRQQSSACTVALANVDTVVSPTDHSALVNGGLLSMYCQSELFSPVTQFAV